jgi:hypothetical protein
MPPLAPVLCLAAAALGLALSATAATQRTAGCTPGPTKVNGKEAMVFCGPAKATVQVSGKRFTITSGTCLKTSKYVNINIGTNFIDSKLTQAFFGLVVGQYPSANKGTKLASKDGTYTGGLVAVSWKGKEYSADTNVTITLKKNRSAGTFSGVGHFTPTLKVSGSFSC